MDVVLGWMGTESLRNLLGSRVTLMIAMMEDDLTMATRLHLYNDDSID